MMIDRQNTLSVVAQYKLLDLSRALAYWLSMQANG